MSEEEQLEKLSESIHMMLLEQLRQYFILWEVCRNVCCDFRSPVESVAHWEVQPVLADTFKQDFSKYAPHSEADPPVLT